jgi:hypothetical protein
MRRDGFGAIQPITFAPRNQDDFIVAIAHPAWNGSSSLIQSDMAYGQLPMTAIWRQFLLFLSTASDRELVSMIEYQRAELRILRANLPKRLEVTAAEKRILLKPG